MARFAGQGGLNKDSAVWLDGARPACIPPSFWGNVPAQPSCIPTPRNTVTLGVTVGRSNWTNMRELTLVGLVRYVSRPTMSV
jgi:hypothetical protein